MNTKHARMLATGTLIAGLTLGTIGYAYGEPVEVGDEGLGAVAAGAVERAGGGLAGIVADLTGLDVRDVLDRRADGESFADIAEAEGVEAESVRSEALDRFEEQLDERMNSTEAPPMRRERPGPNPIEALAEATGLDTSDIHERLVGGESMAAIAEAEGVDIEAVIDAIIADADEHLSEAVDDGRLTEEQKAERLERLSEGLEEIVNSTELPERRGPGHGGPGAGPEGGAAPAPPAGEGMTL